MDEEIVYFSVSLKKIEGTANDFEQILRINPCFQVLSKKKLAQVEEIVSRSVEDMRTILKFKE